MQTPIPSYTHALRSLAAILAKAETLSEILALECIAKEAMAESRFKGAEFSVEKFTMAAERAAADTSRHGVLIAARSDSPIGFAYCNVGEPLVETGLLITTVQVLYVGKSTRDTLLGGKAANALLNGVLSWSKSRRTEELLIHTTSGIKADVNDRFLRRRGFQVVGGSYVYTR
jgi:hypothetical protein